MEPSSHRLEASPPTSILGHVIHQWVWCTGGPHNEKRETAWISNILIQIMKNLCLSGGNFISSAILTNFFGAWPKTSNKHHTFQTWIPPHPSTLSPQTSSEIQANSKLLSTLPSKLPCTTVTKPWRRQKNLSSPDFLDKNKVLWTPQIFSQSPPTSKKTTRNNKKTTWNKLFSSPKSGLEAVQKTRIFVGGWTNPSEKYYLVKLEIFP